MRRPPSQKKMQADCDRFNQRNLVGSKVRVWPGAVHDGLGQVVEIREPGAYILSGHTAVVQVTGGHGCIALSHVAPAGEA